MGIKKKWICDGCDNFTETDMEAEQSSFYQSKVTCGAWGEQFILCPDCHNRLLKQINPKEWPRATNAAPYQR